MLRNQSPSFFKPGKALLPFRNRSQVRFFAKPESIIAEAYAN